MIIQSINQLIAYKDSIATSIMNCKFGDGAALDQQDFSMYNNWGLGGTDFTFLRTIYSTLGVGMLNIIQHVGLWGAILVTMFLIIGLVVWQGNQKERTKVVKHLGTLIISFILLINLVAWISWFQSITYAG